MSACPDCPEFVPDSVYHLHQHVADLHGAAEPTPAGLPWLTDMMVGRALYSADSVDQPGRGRPCPSCGGDQ